MDNVIEYSFDALMQKTKKELHLICTENNLKKYKSLNKKPLVELMLDNIPKKDNILQKENEEDVDVDGNSDSDDEEEEQDEEEQVEDDSNTEETKNITNTQFDAMKSYINNVLNPDKSTYQTTNDETTPIGCVQEMLSRVPKSFWKRKSLRIIDPCCGNGNFNFIAHSLIKENTDRTDKDIIENSLFFNDLNLDRIENVKILFNGKEFNLNITTDDFLEYPEDELYDMHVVNPPYAKFLKSGKRAAGNHA